MVTIHLDMIQSIGLAIILLLIGRKCRKKIKFLDKFCIPSPVIGGLLFAILTLILKELNILQFKFDDILQNFFMTMFFTSVGFNASLKVLKKGGVQVLVFLIVAVGLIVIQNIVSVVLATNLGLSKSIALMAGSTALTGGHGTAAAISQSIQDPVAKTVAIAAATFGLVAGSMIGGPIARGLIEKHSLLEKYSPIDGTENVEHDETFFDQKESILNGEKFARAFFTILLAMAIGTLFNMFFKYIGLKKLPYYLGPMIVAAIIRNVTDIFDAFVNSPMEEIKIVENVSLNLFLSMALMSLRLWELLGIAIPVIVLLVVQTLITAIYTRYITFNVMGANYDAAVIVAGHCGFGLGATPNGITNMETICEKYQYSKLAFFTVPIVGALFIDFFNVGIITLFISRFS
ncbi:sodium/glutamate symporter [uncultured Sneathia sp.]|uniref:sodium/glutamate symporter n=1 Tax=uncultured Sneathia sp. TaxID=278067 RepID=UPI002598A147|nr:sodium/glutamate symporter [uncultured Sneathia sp.]